MLDTSYSTVSLININQSYRKDAKGTNSKRNYHFTILASKLEGKMKISIGQFVSHILILENLTSIRRQITGVPSNYLGFDNTTVQNFYIYIKALMGNQHYISLVSLSVILIISSLAQT